MKGRNDADFSHSLTDLMSGLAVMFLLIAAIFMVQASKATAQAKTAADDALEAKKQADEEAQKRKIDADELAALKAVNLQNIQKLKNLSERLRRDQKKLRIEPVYDPKDPLLLTIRFTDETLQFPVGQCQVGAIREHDLEQTLKELLPQVCDVLSDEADVNQSIVLEGHTDALPASGAACGMSQNTGEGFENNVRLSAARAQYVFFLARKVVEQRPETKKCLQDNFVVAGRGNASLANPGDPYAKENRRVEIKVRLGAARTSNASGT
jgi:flagellar motor protein MotB